MSYILDALRRADAQRERDPARGIHAQPAAVPVPAPRSPVLAWLAGFLGAGVIAVAAYPLWQPEPPEPAPAVRITPTVQAAKPQAPVVANVISPAPAPAAPAPVVQKVAVAAPERAAPRPAAAASSAAAPVAPAAAGPAAAGERVVAFSDLPAEVQRELPKLAISGGVHSDNAAQRLLVVGGQVVNEGAELAPGLVLEQIRARSAVLRFKGWRYSVGF